MAADASRRAPPPYPLVARRQAYSLRGSVISCRFTLQEAAAGAAVDLPAAQDIRVLEASIDGFIGNKQDAGYEDNKGCSKDPIH